MPLRVMVFQYPLSAKLYSVTTALMIAIGIFKKNLLIVALLLVMKASALGTLSLGDTLKKLLRSEKENRVINGTLMK